MSSVSDFSTPPSWIFGGKKYEFNYAIDDKGQTKIWSQLSSQDRKAAYDVASKLLRENTKYAASEANSKIVMSGSVAKADEETSRIFHFTLATKKISDQLNEADSPKSGSDSDTDRDMSITSRSPSTARSSSPSVSPPPLLSPGLLTEAREIIGKMEKTYELQTINEDIERLINLKYQIDDVKKHNDKNSNEDIAEFENLVSTFLNTRFKEYVDFVDKTIKEVEESHDLSFIQEKMSNFGWARSRLEECGQIAAKLEKQGTEEQIIALNEKVALFVQERMKALYENNNIWLKWFPEQREDTPIPQLVAGIEALQANVAQLTLLDKEWATFKEHADPKLQGYDATIEFTKSQETNVDHILKFVEEYKKFFTENQNSALARLEKNNRFFDYERIKLLGKIPDSSWQKLEEWVNRKTNILKNEEMPKDLVEEFQKSLKNEGKISKASLEKYEKWVEGLPETEEVPKELVKEFREALTEDRDLENFRYYLSEIIRSNIKLDEGDKL